MQNNLFNPEIYSGLRKPLLEASTLPAWCYSSEDFYQREIGQIFPGNWQFAGHISQLADPSQYICHEGIGGSVVVMRTQDHGIKAFANSCRHRGSRLLSDRGSCKSIVCPYHSWVYQTDGKLIRTPGMEEVVGFNKDEFPLLELALETLGGFIFVHYQTPDSSLKDYLGNLAAMLETHRSTEMQFVHSIDFDINSNWKLLAENALEAYHTGTVHRKTLGQQEFCPIDRTANWTGLLVKDEHSVATMPGDSKPFPHIKGLDNEASRGTYFTLLFPSTQLVFAQDCMWWLALKPEAVDRTRLTLARISHQGAG